MPSPRRCGCTISSGPVSRRRSARTIYIVIENYVVWKIQDPERFVETVGDAIAAEMRLHDIIWSGLSAALGTHDMESIVSTSSDKVKAGEMLDKLTELTAR